MSPEVVCCNTTVSSRPASQHLQVDHPFYKTNTDTVQFVDQDEGAEGQQPEYGDERGQRNQLHAAVHMQMFR